MQTLLLFMQTFNRKCFAAEL